MRRRSFLSLKNVIKYLMINGLIKYFFVSPTTFGFFVNIFKPTQCENIYKKSEEFAP